MDTKPSYLRVADFDAAEVTRHGIVVHETPHYRPDPLTQLSNGFKELGLVRLLHLFELTPQSFAHGLTLDGEAFPLMTLCTNISEPRKSNVSGPAFISIQNTQDTISYLGIAQNRRY